MQGLQFDIKRPGFPVKIGEVELWFDNSPENLVNVFKAREVIKEKELELGKKMKQYEDLNEETMTYEASQEIIQHQKDFIATYYNNIFGEGSFEKVYDKYPHINQLEELIPVLDVAIANRIEELEAERDKEVESIQNEYLNKTAKK